MASRRAGILGGSCFFLCHLNEARIDIEGVHVDVNLVLALQVLDEGLSTFNAIAIQ